MQEEPDPLSPYEVFEGTPWESGLLHSILADNEIEAILKDNSRLAWNTFPVDSSLVKVYVAYQDLSRAESIVEEFRNNMQQVDPEAEE
jgi:hypothetical protein